MKRALTHLLVAILGFGSAVVELATRIVRLCGALVDDLSRHVGSKPASASLPKLETPPARARGVALTVDDDNVHTRAMAPTVAIPDAADRLTSALTGLGFKGGPTRAYVATVRGRLEKESLDGLVREGIAKLSD